MTFEEACHALHYEDPPDWLNDYSRKMLIATAERLSENGTKPIEPGHANLVRIEVEMFG